MAMKRIFLMLILLVSATIAHADEYPYIAFQTTDGQIATLSTKGLRFFYADGTLTATNNEERQSFQTAQLSLMYFTDTATSIATLDAQGRPVNVEIFAADGRNMGRFTSLKEAVLRLPKGAYIVKANGKTIKIALQ